MSRSAVVFGAGGQLGVELVRELAARGFSATGYDRRQVDIADPAAVESALAQPGASVVFNAAAYNQVDLAEKEPQAAFLVNGLAVRNLALACREIGARLVHFSTDYVFDGSAGRSYVEEDATHPLGAYGVSKLAGELYAQAYLERVLVVRTSGVFGPQGRGTARGNFLETMLRLAETARPIRVVEDYFASPTYAPWLAARALDLVERDQTGVFHVGGGAPVSWFEFARAIFEVFGVHPELAATNGQEHRTAARRPVYSALSNGKMERLGIAAMPPLRAAIEAYAAERSRLTGSPA